MRRSLSCLEGKIAILYGSATGTAESYAKMLGNYAVGHGFEPVVCSMNEGINVLKENNGKLSAAVFICSTYGSGEFPSNAEKFFKELDGGTMVGVKDLRYAVMGLGNSKNDNFNAAAKRLDSKMKQLGAKSFLRMHLSCEYQGKGHDTVYRTFKRSVWAALGGSAGSLCPTYKLIASAAEGQSLEEASGFYPASLTFNELLTPQGYYPHHRLVTLNIPVEAQKKQLGGRVACKTDHIQIMPICNEELVNRAAKHLCLPNLDAVFTVEPVKGAPRSYFDEKHLTVRTILSEIVDLSACPTRTFLEALAEIAEVDTDKITLHELADDLTSNSKYDKLCSGVFTIVDAMEMFPRLPLTLELLMTYAPHIAQRTYSPASAVREGGESFQVVFSVPHRESEGKTHGGLCTSMLEHTPINGNVYVRFVPSGLTMPKYENPLVIFALGSGIGTARAILQDRALAKQAGKKVAKAALFYGFRHMDKDALFGAELDSFVREDLLDIRRVASHDQKEFLTPMDKVDASVKDFLGSTGEVYYCGLGGSAPVLVESALRGAGLDIGSLRASDRYHEEYFSPDFDMENLMKNHRGAVESASTLTARVGKTDMFCFQCEQTFKGTGCTKIGVCGKTPRVAALQDLTVHAVKLMGFLLHERRSLGAAEMHELNRLTLGALFATLTNVNNDESRFVALLHELKTSVELARADYLRLCKEKGVAPKAFNAMDLPEKLPSVDGLVDLAHNVGVLTRFVDAKTQSQAALGEMLMYGLKGLAAYTDHSLMNNRERPEIYEFIHKALHFLIGPDANDLGKGLGLAIELGGVNVGAMGLLYDSNKSLGVPSPAQASLKPVPGKCILVSGHDLIMLKALLEKTEPLGINVYTHGEMLPAHGYPALRAHKNLAGHFGGAWMRQSVEFPHFPGPIVMTTNCLTEPHESYRDNIFTAGAVGWEGLPHIGNNMKDIRYDSVIEAAQKAKGFTTEKEFSYTDPVGVKRPAHFTVGFGHETVLSVAPTILQEVQKGNITRFFVIGGCDGFEGQRSYYTELAQQLPKTAVILTVGCGKFRINHLDLGTIGDTGIPRILDMGQCNDSYSAVQVAIALADALKCKVSDLPLSIVLSWFEQKAVAVLLSCLHLGLKPIHIGPSLPAFITPEILDVLVKQFGVMPVGNPAADAKAMCAAAAMS